VKQEDFLNMVGRISRRNIRFLGALALALTIGAAAMGVATPAQAATDTVCTVYTVQPGDWLSKIAARYGVTWQYLAQINHLANPNLIYVGEHIATCGSVTGPPPPPPPPSNGGAAGTDWALEMCHSNVYYTGSIYMWKVPPGCYAGVYWPNQANYVYRSGFGWCNWWPEVLHPSRPNILWGTRHSSPIPGAVAVFAPGEQGASSSGHYGEVVAILPGNWILISEMNDTWRGAGFGRVNYRYVWEDSGVTYIW
jgi:hypothetical protein